MSDALDAAVFHTSGVPEVSAEFVHETLGQYRLVDCRQPEELVGPLGKIADIENVPMSDLQAAAPTWGDEPVIIVCRSGTRSGNAAGYFAHHGIGRVISMAGGMMAWQALGFETA